MSRAFKTFQFNGIIYAYDDYEPEFIIAGDTDSTYIDLSSKFDKDANIDDVCAFADEIGNIVNRSFPQFMKDIFNVSEERAKVIQTDREVVSDKSYFLAKKMYVMHVVDKEGKRVVDTEDNDNLKMMGVSIKKTDTPEVVQKFLKDLVNLLMDKEEYKNIESFISDFKKQYHGLDAYDIGRPISAKGFRKYEIEYEKHNTMKGFPYHIRASLFYNSLCSVNDRRIVSGDKIKVIYINHSRSKYIAVPVDIEEIPSFVKDIEIDWRSQWETVQKKINIFLKPIGYDRESRQKALNNKLLKF